MPKRADIQLSKMLLDNENPRHDPIDNEAEIIATLIAKEQVIPLAKDIAARKQLNPLEVVGVLPHPSIRGKFVVAEGNRRVCALQLLHDPDKAPAQHRELFQDLSKKSKSGLPKSLNVVLLTDKEEARHWKAVRHEGAQGGVGTRSWSAAGKNRNAKQGNRPAPNNLAVELLQYASSSGLITPDQQAMLKLTTLTRYLSSPVMRNTLGIASNGQLLIDVPTDEFNVAVKAFLEDAIPGPDALVHSRSNGKERESYASNLRARGLAPKTKLDTPVIPTPQKVRSERNSRSPSARAHVVPSTFKAKLRNKVLKRVFDELRDIDLKFNFASAYLFRAFLEQLVHQYATDNNLSKGGELHQVINRCVEHMEKSQDLIDQLTERKLNNLLKPWRVMVSDRDSRLSPETIGAWVHGSIIPTSAEIKSRWDTLEPGFTLLIEGLK